MAAVEGGAGGPLPPVIVEVEDVLTIAAPLLGSIVGLVTNAIAAGKTGDQATLDALHAQALAAANALRPAGAAPLT